MRFKTQGVCSREISFEVKDNKLTNVQFVGGCSGNTQGLSRLIEGMDWMRLSEDWMESSAVPGLHLVRINWLGR